MLQGPLKRQCQSWCTKKKLKKVTAKKETEAKKTKELQKSMEIYVKEKSSTKRATQSIKNNPSGSAKPSPAPIKDDPTGERDRTTFLFIKYYLFKGFESILKFNFRDLATLKE